MKIWQVFLLAIIFSVMIGLASNGWVAGIVFCAILWVVFWSRGLKVYQAFLLALGIGICLGHITSVWLGLAAIVGLVGVVWFHQAKSWPAH